MIVEIWVKKDDLGLPVCFTQGEAPKIINEEGVLIPISESPEVKSISFYETGAFAGKAYRGPCYVVQLVDSALRRIIPAKYIRDIGFAVPEKDTVKTPSLED